MKIGCIVCISACLAFGRIALFEMFEFDRSLDHLVGEEKIFRFKVITLPSRSGSKSKMEVLSPEGSKIALTATTFSELFYGDELEVVGVLKQVPQGYFLKDKIFYKISSRNIKILSRTHGNIFVTNLFRLRVLFLKTIYIIFPSPHGELVMGITVEGADSISKELKEKFRRTGLSHIVALSGTNVAIVIQSVTMLLKRAKRGVRFSVVCAFILAFAIMTGLSSTVVRASLMALIAVCADIVRRKNNTLRGLILSLGIMSLWNPYTPLFDVSFQLSFIATLSMIVVVPIIERFLKFIRYETLRETLSTTLSAEVLVTPVILYYSGHFSIIAPLCNVLVVPLIPFAMLFGALPALFAFSHILSIAISLPGYLAVSYIFFIVNFFSDLSFAAVEVHISLLTLVGIYTIICLLLWYAYKKLGMKLEV